MTDILREVDEAMRVEKLTRLWQEHGSAVLAGIAALILGTAAHSAWNAWTTHQNIASTTALLEALGSEHPLNNLETLANSEQGKSRHLALITAAAQAINEKKYPEAQAFYQALIAEKSAPPLLRDLAIVQSVNLTLDHTPDAKAEELLATLRPVMQNKKSPWQGQAVLTGALVKAHKSNDQEGAIADLKLIVAHEDWPSSLRQRAQALIDTYQVKLQGNK